MTTATLSPSATAQARPSLEKVALYIHIPFCQTRCHYCDFNTYAGMLPWRRAYVEALVREIRLSGERAARIYGHPLRASTIFFGGGTPSLLLPDQIATLITACRDSFALDSAAEISLEANPGTITEDYLRAIRHCGVNRLSIGAQTFDPDLLRWLGRIHKTDQIVAAYHAARRAGFDNINLDFIFGIPNQTMAQWQATLQYALELAPDHLSLYSLIIEEGTPLYKWVEQGRVQPADDDLVADMYLLAEKWLATAGYEHYEIANWARPGHRCAHNLTYWHNEPWLGFGAGAHSWYRGCRFANVRPIQEYIERITSQGDAVAEKEWIPRDLELAETAMLELRLLEGINVANFNARYGISFMEHFGDRLWEPMAASLMVEQDGWVRLTDRGRLLSNEVFLRLLP
jgi:oxygen-independent coproporphyrinogen-3 oxidase